MIFPARKREDRIARWYFGGLASAGAACITHPLDLLKVHLQTQQEAKYGLIQMAKIVVKKHGVLALYNGLSASILRQLTYSMTRFGIYEVAKHKVKSDTFFRKVCIAGGAGLCGGFVGTPADMMNVRMQNDIKLPEDQRRNYKHAIDGLIRVYKEEGFTKLFSGASTASARAVFMTIGQLSFYDQVKYLLLKTNFFKDDLVTHFLSSLTAGIIALLMTQPLDVIKTRKMNSAPGEFKNMWAIVVYTAEAGPLAFFKGITASASRLIPLNILLFIFYEQLRLNFGYYASESPKPVDTKPHEK